MFAHVQSHPPDARLVRSLPPRAQSGVGARKTSISCFDMSNKCMK
jgi:hypothetical protein